MNLANYLEVSLKRYANCIDEIVHEVILAEAPKATVHFKYVKFDPTTGEPKFDVLAKSLAKHVVRYSLSTRTRQQMETAVDFDQVEGELFMKARDYFRKIQKSGEVGELLLFFLLEAAFQAPQVVCKMELKTNPKDEVKGTDGIHIKWDSEDGHMDVFLGESKLHQQISGALDSVFQSITDLHDTNRLDEELEMVTVHFKHLDQDLKDVVTRFINRETSESECHIIHACLVGWDWNEYRHLLTEQREEFFRKFDAYYIKYAPNIAKMLADRFKDWKYKHLTFKFLFVPFKDVGEFRRAFYKELCGVDIELNNS